MSAVRRVAVMVLSALLALGAVSVVQGQSAVARPPHTIKKIVRPVHRDGTPVRGYRVVVEDSGDYEIECNEQSPISVSSGVSRCGSSADYLLACWPSQDYSILCLRDPQKRVLVRIYGVYTFQRARAYKRPSPAALTLRKYGSCLIRGGGAWDRPKQHPSWFGFYGCSSKRHGYTAVYGPGSRRDGIVRKSRAWRVDLLSYGKDYKQRPMRSDRVRVAYYVGTAK